MREIIICGILLFHILYALLFSIEFYKTDRVYSKKIKDDSPDINLGNSFFMGLLVTTGRKKTLGSKYYIDYKQDQFIEDDGESPFYESKKGFWN
jgi:hypothetical protein